MAKKRTAKAKSPATLGSVFPPNFGDRVEFSFVSILAHLFPAVDYTKGIAAFARHLAAGNIVPHGEAGFAPGVPTYRIAKPDAPAFI